ncbi:hypothetical protein HMSSN036_29190 [Paenibacillus macerans]|nr:hypothetical protein HMSSN036_29190 [Paenibacillus macerans]
MTDLPGIYTLRPLSRDEGVAAEFLAAERPSLLVNIVDASNLERNLYLTLQLLEYGQPVIIGLNMMDVAKANGIDVNIERLAACWTPRSCRLLPAQARAARKCLRRWASCWPRPQPRRRLRFITETSLKRPFRTFPVN